MSRARLIIIVAAAIAVVAGVAITALVRRDPGGMATLDEVVAEYIEGLQARAGSRVKRLADPDHIADAAIERRLAQLGGGRLVIDDVFINPG